MFEILGNNNKSCSICCGQHYAKGHYRSKWQRTRKDSEYRSKINKQHREYQRERLKDPEYRNQMREYKKEYQRERLKDPGYPE